MEKKNEDLNIKYVGEHPAFGKVGCKIKIKDGGALHTFTDSRYAKLMYFEEKKLNPRITFNERLKSYDELFPDEKKEDIAKYFINKLKEHNTKFTQK